MKAQQTTKNLPQIVLGLVIPLSTLLFGLLSAAMTQSNLPERITVHFDISRVPTTSLPTTTFFCVMLGLLALGAGACLSAALSPRPFGLVDAERLASSGGFVSGISTMLLGGAIEIHCGLAYWQDAVGPGWWILSVVIAGFAGAFIARHLALLAHTQGST